MEVSSYENHAHFEFWRTMQRSNSIQFLPGGICRQIWNPLGNYDRANGTAKATEAMAFKLCQQAEKGWRRLKGFEKLELVVKDIKFENGVLKEVA